MSVERIAYRAGSVEAIGALVRGDGAPSDAPLALVSPNWLGVTDAALAQAREIAAGRYHVFVADMFGGGKTASGPQDAAPLADALRSDWAERRARITAGFETMLASAKARGLGDGRRTAAMGFLLRRRQCARTRACGNDGARHRLAARRSRHPRARGAERRRREISRGAWRRRSGGAQTAPRFLRGGNERRRRQLDPAVLRPRAAFLRRGGADGSRCGAIRSARGKAELLVDPHVSGRCMD